MGYDWDIFHQLGAINDEKHRKTHGFPSGNNGVLILGLCWDRLIIMSHDET